MVLVLVIYLRTESSVCVIVFPQYLQITPRAFVSVTTKQANESLLLHSGLT
jgi:hypothetical protein